MKVVMLLLVIGPPRMQGETTRGSHVMLKFGGRQASKLLGFQGWGSGVIDDPAMPDPKP